LTRSGGLPECAGDRLPMSICPLAVIIRKP